MTDAANTLALEWKSKEDLRTAAIDKAYRHTDPDTSRDAARDNAPRAPRHRDLALRTLRDHPEGLTDFELAALTGIAQTSVGKRRLELLRDGLVENTGKRRPSPSGSAAIVWKAVTT